MLYHKHVAQATVSDNARKTVIGGVEPAQSAMATNGREALVLYRKHRGEMVFRCKRNFSRRSVFDTAA
jgi:hypothetical protein